MKTLFSKLSSASLLIAVVSVLLSSAPAQAGPGTVRIGIYKAGFIVGVSGGKGTLTYAGKTYALKIGGVSLGATIGASKAELIGEAENLSKPSDIAGTYTAVQAGVGAAGGSKTAPVQDPKSVLPKIRGKQIGLEFSLDLSGMQISLK